MLLKVDRLKPVVLNPGMENQRKSQPKFFTSIPIAGREDTKPFDITVNVLNIDPAL